jgi:hypothetical protein
MKMPRKIPAPSFFSVLGHISMSVSSFGRTPGINFTHTKAYHLGILTEMQLYDQNQVLS